MCNFVNMLFYILHGQYNLLVCLLQVSETDDTKQEVKEETSCQRLGTILKPFLAPSLILAVLAGSIRNAGIYKWKMIIL